MGKFIRLIILLVMTACIAVGCSQNEEQSADKTEQRLIPISLQLQWFTQAQFAGYYVALEKGWYREEGLDLTIYQGGPDIVPVRLVSDGIMNFGTTLLADLAVSVQKGNTVRSIAQIQQENGVRLLAKKKDGIYKPEDFPGKKVGVWLGGWEVQFNALMSQKNINQKNMEVISQGFSMEPFLDGRLDVASAMIYNEFFMVLEAGVPEEELTIIDYADYGLDFPGDVLFTSIEMIEERPEICLKMLRASLRGWAYALANQNESVDIVLEHDSSGVMNRYHQEKMMEQISLLVQGKGDIRMGYLDKNAFVQMVQLLARYGQIDSTAFAQEVYTLRFIDQISAQEHRR